MSTGENIQFLRKREGFTQESFAEQMGVSRQTISKWESDSCFPEMEKLLQMCEMFRCNLDDLVRGNVQADVAEDTAGYDSHMNTFSKRITTGVVLVMLGVCAMTAAYGLGIGDALSCIVLFLFLTVAVAFFIIAGMEHERFVKKYPTISPLYKEDELEAFHKKFPKMIAAGVACVLFGVIVLFAGEAVLGEAAFDNDECSANLVLAGTLLLIAIGVGFLVYGGMQNGKYDIKEYNKENVKDETRAGKLKSTINGCIMLTATIIFMIWSFAFHAWEISWIVFPIGGMLCGVVSVILKLVIKEQTE